MTTPFLISVRHDPGAFDKYRTATSFALAPISLLGFGHDNFQRFISLPSKINLSPEITSQRPRSCGETKGLFSFISEITIYAIIKPNMRYVILLMSLSY